MNGIYAEIQGWSRLRFLARPVDALDTPAAPPKRKLSPTVVRLGLVSLFTDISSDMVTPLLPIFLTQVLGASFGFVGLVDGAAETVASFLKIFSGRWSDRYRRHKPPTVFGYVLSAVARPIIALTLAPWQVLAVRVTDRIGKGIRSAPRDAWITHVTQPEYRGRAFGFHRAMDNAGAFIGPLLGLALYRGLGLPLRWVFACCVIPGVAAIIAVLASSEPPPETSPSPGAARAPDRARLPTSLKLFLATIFLFTLANASDFFLVLKAKTLHVDDGMILVLWTGLSGLRAIASTPGSLLSDRMGRRQTLLAGWAIYAAVYVGFSFAHGLTTFALLLVAYAGYYGLTEGVERALVADLAPPEARGSAFGTYYAVVGVGALPASYVFGAIADASTIDLAFRVAAGFAIGAAALLAVAVRSRPG
jgi:MFS family permease